MYVFKQHFLVFAWSLRLTAAAAKALDAVVVAASAWGSAVCTCCATTVKAQKAIVVDGFSM